MAEINWRKRGQNGKSVVYSGGGWDVYVSKTNPAAQRAGYGGFAATGRRGTAVVHAYGPTEQSAFLAARSEINERDR